MATTSYTTTTPGTIPAVPFSASTATGSPVTPHLQKLPWGQWASPTQIYGSKVGQLGMPDPFGNLSGVDTQLPTQNAAAGQALTSELSGQLSPQTMNAIQNAAAAWGVNSGTPGGALQWDNALTNLGMNTEQLQNMGISNYGKLIPTESATQTVSPQLQSEISYQNLLNTAAPDPAAAGEHNLYLYLDALAKANQSQSGFSLGPISADWGSNGFGFNTPFGGYGTTYNTSVGGGGYAGQGMGGGGSSSGGNGMFGMSGTGGANPFASGGGGGSGMDMGSLMMLAGMI